MIFQHLVGRGETEIQNSHQKMDEKATIEHTRIGVNAKGMAQVGQSTFFRAAPPGVSSVVKSKKGESFAREGAKGFKKTFIVAHT